MKNFDFYNPTRILFGEGQIKKISTLIDKQLKVMVVYGGGSIKKNGVYDQVMEALKGHTVIEKGGIPPNPEYDVLLDFVKTIKEEKVDFLLAVGGGSVIDGTKFLSAAAYFEGDTPWDILTKRIPITKAMPFASVLTLPATGSEMNSGSVVSRRETQEKLAFMWPSLFPQFSILDPKVIESIPKHQIANGIADAFTHVLEQYVTYPANAHLQDRLAESVLQTLVEVAPKILEDQTNYAAASNFMWSCTMALNGLLSCGVPSDWVIHMLGHELTALHGIDHACTLAVIAKSHYLYNIDDKKEKLAQLAQRIFNITHEDTLEQAKLGIEAMDNFFNSIGIETKLSAYTENYKGTAEKICDTLTSRQWMELGEKGKVSPNDAKKIIMMSY